MFLRGFVYIRIEFDNRGLFSFLHEGITKNCGCGKIFFDSYEKALFSTIIFPDYKFVLKTLLILVD